MRAFKSFLFKLALVAAIALPGMVGANQDGIAKTKLNEDYFLSGPYSHDNLTVFLVHGKEKISGKKILSLTEAMDKKVVTIHETGEVNRLMAQNHSADHFIFIQSGDIVKGGRQDRTLGQDVLLPPKSKKIALDSFCVEQGRWHPRGPEQAATFASSKKHLSSKELKLAAKKAKSQAEVWKAVADEQERLSRKVGKSVKSSASETSLQLSLEDGAVEAESRKYQRALLPAAQAQNDAVGFAYAVNGAFVAADIYGHPDLFQKLWPKLIEAVSCEAAARPMPAQASAPPDMEIVKTGILEGLSKPKAPEPSDEFTRRATSESKNHDTFETKDEKGQLVHLNVIKK